VRVAILFNDDGRLAAGTAEDALAVAAVAATAREACLACESLGWQPVLVAAAPDPAELCARLRATRPDVVLNLCESLRGDARLEAAVAALLELLALPFTGSSSKTLAVALDKPVGKAVLREHGVATPDSFVAEGPGFERKPLPFPVIVKPSREDGSHGISTASVCRDEQSLRARVAFVVSTYKQPALVEEFVEGREINVSLLAAPGGGAIALPLAEIDFGAFPAGQPRLVTFEAKWVEGSPEYRGTPVVAARGLDAATERRIVASSLSAWHALGLAGYGRVDLRLCERRGPLVLEVNPNPDLSRDAGFAKAASRAGISYPELLRRIVEGALR
jgi:D-alanine-D-alanine ligase